MTDNQTAPRPFSGLRVVDFSTLIAGPYGTRYLADLGAEVIKIETPEGDYLRTQAPLRDGHSTYFGQLNCGKKSVALNLKDPDTIAELKKLIATADVLVENFRPGVMARFGLDFETLAALNPRLIYSSRVSARAAWAPGDLQGFEDYRRDQQGRGGPDLPDRRLWPRRGPLHRGARTDREALNAGIQEI